MTDSDVALLGPPEAPRKPADLARKALAAADRRPSLWRAARFARLARRGAREVLHGRPDVADDAEGRDGADGRRPTEVQGGDPGDGSGTGASSGPGPRRGRPRPVVGGSRRGRGAADAKLCISLRSAGRSRRASVAGSCRRAVPRHACASSSGLAPAGTLETTSSGRSPIQPRSLTIIGTAPARQSPVAADASPEKDACSCTASSALSSQAR